MINYKLDKINFESAPASTQAYTLSYKKGTNAAKVITENLRVARSGKVLDPPIINGLGKDTVYTFILTNNEDTTLVFSFDVRTPIEFTIGPNPVTLKKMYPGQALDIPETGLFSSSLPEHFGGFYFFFDANYKDIYEGFANAIPSGGPKFTTATDVPGTRRETGADFVGGRYISLNNQHLNLEARLNMETLNGLDGSRHYSRFIMFYVDGNTINARKYLYWSGTEFDHVCAYIEPNLYVTIEHVRDGVVKSATSSAAITVKKWYNLEMRYKGVPADNFFFLWSDNSNLGFSNSSNIDLQPNGDSTKPILIGTKDGNITSEGILIKRFYNAPTYIDDNNTLYVLRDYRDYLPKLIFEDRNNPAIKHIIPNALSIKLNDVNYSTSLPVDMALGNFYMYIQTSKGPRTKYNVQVVPFSVRTNGFELDFENNFNGALADFKTLFNGNRSSWGGANGGVNPELVYANRDSKSLVLEAHGDIYNGSIVGVERGTGNPAVHNIVGDPLYGQAWKTRVGSTILSTDYLGYGEATVRWKIPSGIYGVAPAIWFFHYIELYPADPRFEYWKTRGIKPYFEEGEESYLVVNNEIDIEQPSHLAQENFKTWAEQSTSYFHPDSLDTLTHISVEEDPDESKNGLFRLNNVSAPNVFGSWVKVSNTWQRINQPSFDHCKFNNWIGEKDSGTGISKENASLEGEEYLALLTDLEYNYADGQFHDWTIKWFKTHTELWIDGVKKRENKMFVPFNGMKLTIGLWFPSSNNKNVEPWKYLEARAWAGFPADFHALQIEVNKISYTPYDETTAGGEVELHSETYPGASLVQLK